MNERVDRIEKNRRIHSISEQGDLKQFAIGPEAVPIRSPLPLRTTPVECNCSATARDSAEFGYDFLADFRRPRRLGAPSAGGSPISSAVQIEVTNFFTP
jgi:hypothetical protein